MRNKLSFRKRLYCAAVVCLAWLAASSINLHAANYNKSEDAPITVSDPPQSMEESRIGMLAPKFTFAKEGKRVSLSDLSNQYVVLNFWTSSSEESRSINAGMTRLEKNYPGSKVTFVDISIDENADIATLYGVSSAPAIYIISPDGCIFDIKKSSTEIEQILNYLLIK